MISIPKNSFARITGTELEHFMAHSLAGDDWGIFLKLATIIESSSKRAIGLKLGIDPDLASVGNIEFFTALRLCRDTELVPHEAFDFANRLRLIRNELVHSGSVLNLSLDQIFQKADGPKYINSLDSFVRIEGDSASDGPQQHRNALMFACLSFIASLAISLFKEDWFQVSSA